VYLTRTIEVDFKRTAKLYQISLGTSQNFDDGERGEIAELGIFVKSIKTFGNYVMANYEEQNGDNKVGLFGEGENKVYIDKFQAASYNVLEFSVNTNNKIICLNSLQYNKVTVSVIDGRGEEREDKEYYIQEFSNMKFLSPFLYMIKGGKEIIKFNFSKNEYQYLKLNSPISICSKTDTNSQNYECLIDIGPYLVYADMNMSFFTLTIRNKFIEKECLPSEKLLNMQKDLEV
jgi:hypothetical protein